MVWSLNILLQILPFTTGTRYGFDDGEEVFGNHIICYLGTGTGSLDTSLTWMQYTFNIELLISFAVIIVLSTAVVFYCLKMNNTVTIQIIRESWSVVILYPCAMLIAWMPSIMYGTYLKNTRRGLPYHNVVISAYLSAISALYGPLLSLIFYSKTLEAREAWIRNFRRLYYFITNSNVDIDDNKDEGRCGSIISIQDISITTSTTSITLINPILSDITRIDEL